VAVSGSRQCCAWLPSVPSRDCHNASSVHASSKKCPWQQQRRGVVLKQQYALVVPILQRGDTLYALQAVRASSAAPYYLDDFLTADGKRFQDGATTANNPTIIALQQARLLHPQVGSLSRRLLQTRSHGPPCAQASVSLCWAAVHFVRKYMCTQQI
jgi:hypothetical protein